ncbi:transposase [Streptomyces sp. NPDC056704]|uniref:transposase n=1 Tax=Streptomyces TaxID=1883 RepID=UPI0036785EBC
MLAAALEAEGDAYIAELSDERDEQGRRLVVRNGHHQPRRVTTSAGSVEVSAPRVNDKWTSCPRRSSTSAGLYPATVTRLTAQWQDDHGAFQDRDLSRTDYVYVWVDGIHLRIRLDQAKAAVLVVLGVCADGTKELVAMADGCCKSSEAWAGLLRDCTRRGMRAPVLAVGRRARVLEGPARGFPHYPRTAVLGSRKPPT